MEEDYDDYDPELVGTPSQLKEKFWSFGGIELKVEDEERFFVACKSLSSKL